jgi:hypothetical protein
MHHGCHEAGPFMMTRIYTLISAVLSYQRVATKVISATLVPTAIFMDPPIGTSTPKSPAVHTAREDGQRFQG